MCTHLPRLSPAPALASSLATHARWPLHPGREGGVLPGTPAGVEDLSSWLLSDTGLLCCHGATRILSHPAEKQLTRKAPPRPLPRARFPCPSRGFPSWARGPGQVASRAGWWPAREQGWVPGCRSRGCPVEAPRAGGDGGSPSPPALQPCQAAWGKRPNPSPKRARGRARSPCRLLGDRPSGRPAPHLGSVCAVSMSGRIVSLPPAPLQGSDRGS